MKKVTQTKNDNFDVLAVESKKWVNLELLMEPIISHNTFETFVVGDKNRFAYVAALVAAEKPGIEYNPLFICGTTGVGKTHLLNAIANFIQKNRPHEKIIYISMKKIVSQKLAFLHYYNLNCIYNGDVLIVDDIQFLSSDIRIQKVIFNVFNDFFCSGKQIVFACNKPITKVDNIEPKLLSRFKWGISVEIKPHDYKTQITTLKS